MALVAREIGYAMHDLMLEGIQYEKIAGECWEITGGSGDTVTVGGQSRHVIGYMKDFLFRPDQARTPVSVLSGGERARLTLARAFARPSNLLVLDEPTNDLDLETLDLLQERGVSRHGAAGQP
jgi:ATPase subunit of ABC transporter with duplicated ATPase domains